ncbi:sulfolipid-1 biosynthesis phthioceranic/hydroxyphthioceranic acid synthase [Actinopolyspora erythraea]
MSRAERAMPMETSSEGDPIAVIGVGCRYPGGVDSPTALWEFVARGGDAVSEVPADRWDMARIYDPEPGVPGRSVSRWGGFLADPYGFDADYFRIPADEAEHMDPQHRILLEVACEALEHAGMAPSALRGSDTGVYAGLSYYDYALLASEWGRGAEPYTFSGGAHSVAAGRISYLLGLTGPAIAVDTACSSSLSAVHLACQSLRDGESGMAVAGGVALHLSPAGMVAASGLGMLSPQGRCAAFDQEADGFVRAEGCGVVVLKRLVDAVRDGDRMLAVLRGTAMNQDGRSEGLMAPHAPAQEAVQQAALSVGGVDPATVGMIEAHGTGTPVGDPIEFAALDRVYGRGSQPCALGSVKTNLGHTEAAAGVVGLIKAVLAVEHGLVPASLHFRELNPDIDAEGSRLFVPTEPTPWPVAEGPRRAAVSSYGVSGTNAHAVVEQAPPAAAVPAEPSTVNAQSPALFVVSASTPAALTTSAGRIADWLENEGRHAALADVASTLDCHREHRKHRLAVVAGTHEELTTRLRCAQADADDPAVVRGAAVGDGQEPVWLFSGQGSQWSGMGRELLACDEAFAAVVEELEPLIAAESGFSVTDALRGMRDPVGVAQIQPTLFAMQVGLAAAWRARGVRPGAVIGHSMGEAAAAVVAGALSVADGARVVCRRAALMSRVAGRGAMASVSLPAARVAADIDAADARDVVIGVVASPTSTVVSGDTAQVRALLADWERRGETTREVAVDVASHSPQLDSILTEMSHALADLDPAEPTRTTFYSTVADDPCRTPTFDAQYWVDNLRGTVRFHHAVEAALADGHRVFTELSSHPLLTHAVTDTAEHSAITVEMLPSLLRDQRLPHGLLPRVAAAHCAGAAVDFQAMMGSGSLVDVPLPVWDHQQLILESRARPRAVGEGEHPLLGVHVSPPGEPDEHLWRGDVGLEAHPWLADHRVQGLPAFPGAGYVELALAAGTRIFGGSAVEIRDIGFEQMLFLDQHTPLYTVATQVRPERARLAVFTTDDDGGEHIRRASATLHSLAPEEAPASLDIAGLREKHPDGVDPVELRDLMRRHGLEMGPAFSAIDSLGSAQNDAASLLADVRLPAAVRTGSGDFDVHPVLLDACFQSLLGMPGRTASHLRSGLFLPQGIDRVRQFGQVEGARYCLAWPQFLDSTTAVIDMIIANAHGTVLLAIEGLRAGVRAEQVFTVNWRDAGPATSPETTAQDTSWLVIGEDTDDGLTQRLAEVLREQAGQCLLHTAALDSDGDHQVRDAVAARLQNGPCHGVVLLCPPTPAGHEESSRERARDRVRRLARVSGALAEADNEHLPRLHIVTRGAQHVPDCAEPVITEHAGLRGMLRVLGTEHPSLRPAHLDIDAATTAEQVAAHLMADTDEDEVAYRGGRQYLARLQPAPLHEEDRRTTTAHFDRDGVVAELRVPGDPDTLELVARPRQAAGPGEVEVAVHAAGLNFVDALSVMGANPTDDDVPPLGPDMAGVVVDVGDQVTDLEVGDRVMGLSYRRGGTWGTFVTSDAALCVPVPQQASMEQAAALPAVYLTAWYGLVHRAGLQAGERVLIHAATGGVGLVAVAIATMLGAEVYATAGTERKRAHLRELGITHVYDSRSLDFADHIRHDTAGAGIDVVLNSLTGAAQRESLDLLAVDGRFVEIGKKDIYGDTKLGLYPFRRNISVFSVDIALMTGVKPAQLGDMLREIAQHIDAGQLPLLPTTSHPLEEAGTAVRVMAAAEHIGKLVLTVPRTDTTRIPIPARYAPLARSDGSYLITGGLGALGLLMAEHLATNGAGRIVLNARSQPGKHVEDILRRLREAGTEVHIELGDIAEADTAARLVTTATATGLPLRGVLHAAALVEDAAITNITGDQLARNWAPKVHGAWHLHQTSLDQPLDWFCCFSSFAALTGHRGQGAYAAANSWLDAFTHWRRTQGLTAHCIAWGAWAQLGRGAFLEHTEGIASIDPHDGVRAFDQLLRHDRAYAGYAPDHHQPWIDDLARRSPFAAAYAPHHSDTAQAEHATLQELRELPPADRPAHLQQHLARTVSQIVRTTVDPDRAFKDYGLDSLGGLELRTRLEKTLGLRVSVKTLAAHSTARTLTDYLMTQLALDTDASTVTTS